MKSSCSTPSQAKSCLLLNKQMQIILWMQTFTIPFANKQKEKRLAQKQHISMRFCLLLIGSWTLLLLQAQAILAQYAFLLSFGTLYTMTTRCNLCGHAVGIHSRRSKRCTWPQYEVGKVKYLPTHMSLLLNISEWITTQREIYCYKLINWNSIYATIFF